MKNTLPYFDTAHLLKNSKATIVVEIGLVDQTCPSTSVYSAINQAKGKKIIYPVPYREHTWPTTEQRKIWDPMVFNPKNAFCGKLPEIKKLLIFLRLIPASSFQTILK